jgi:hypothetical protein
VAERFDYSEFVALAVEMVNEFGRDVQLVKLDDQPADPARPQGRKGDDHVVRSAPAVFVAPSLLARHKIQLRAECIAAALVAAAAVPNDKLELFNRLLDGDDQWALEQVEHIGPGSDRILYILGLVRAT